MLGTRIASLRKNRGLGQAELAGHLHISSSALGMYEQGRREPSVDSLCRLSALFGVSLEYLLTGRPATAPDAVARHQMLKEGAAVENMALTGEEAVCHLLWILLE